MYIRYFAVNTPNPIENNKDYEYTCINETINESYKYILMDDIGYNEIVKINVSATERKLYWNDTAETPYDRIYLQKNSHHKIRGHILAVNETNNWKALKNGAIISVL